MADLTVIVPLYNTEKYIEQCIQSILMQSLQDIEVIIVNDGSTDKSIEICEKIIARDNRVRIIHQENGGLSKARYAGLKACKTHYVTFVDADDFILEKSYIMGIEAMQKDIDMIFFEICRYYDEHRYKVEHHVLKEGYYTREDIVQEVYPKLIWNFERNTPGIECSQCVRIVKKELLIAAYDNLKGKGFYYGEDIAITYPLYKMIKDMEVIKEYYYLHRQRKTECAPYIIADHYFQEVYGLYSYLIEEFCQEAGDMFFRKQIEYLYIYSVKLKKQKYGEIDTQREFLFPFNKVEMGKRIVLYGAGEVGCSYYEQLRKLNYCEKIVWVDKNAHFLLKPEVHGVEFINNTECDYVVIAIENKNICDEVIKFLVRFGIDEKKIII